MSESEAQQLAKRLERVWGGQSLEGPQRSICLSLPDQAEVHVWDSYDGRRIRFVAGANCFLVYSSDRGIELPYLLHFREEVEPPGADKEKAQFAAQWLPMFRRGCWLSGCQIEASAHEKAEWIQGITREEIESWDLKL